MARGVGRCKLVAAIWVVSGLEFKVQANRVPQFVCVDMFPSWRRSKTSRNPISMFCFLDSGSVSLTKDRAKHCASHPMSCSAFQSQPWLGNPGIHPVALDIKIGKGLSTACPRKAACGFPTGGGFCMVASMTASYQHHYCVLS